MSATQRPSASDSMILFGTSLLCIFGGLFTYAERTAFAALVLAGHYLFGIPLTGGDAFKLLLIEFGSVISILMGIILFFVGLFLQTRKAAAPGIPSAPTPSR
jgi:predicted transporter